jgi:acid stress chaperone HdeB
MAVTSRLASPSSEPTATVSVVGFEYQRQANRLAPAISTTIPATSVIRSQAGNLVGSMPRVSHQTSARPAATAPWINRDMTHDHPLIQINEASFPAANFVRGTQHPPTPLALAHPLERAGEAAIPWRPLSMNADRSVSPPPSIHRVKCMPRALITIVTAEDKMVVDMSKMTCGELTKLDFQDFAGITMWMSGYYNASVRSTVIDLYEFAQAAKTVKDYCATSPRATVMSAAERALGIKMPRPR